MKMKTQISIHSGKTINSGNHEANQAIKTGEASVAFNQQRDDFPTELQPHPHRVSGHELEDVRITKYGKIYFATNPNLRNPIDWKWIITTIIAVASAIFGAMALFVACSIKYG